MKRSLTKRIAKATSNAAVLLDSYTNTNTNTNDCQQLASTIQTVSDRLRTECVVGRTNDIIVTEIGFITMALLTRHSVYRKDLLLIPGVDEKNQFGYLVLREGHVPYHSLAQNIDDAADDTLKAHEQAEELLRYYGSKASLKQAADDAPWYLWSTLEDARAAGLCTWGSLSFLQRTGFLSFSKNPGLPRLITRLAGKYGDRVSASTIRRLEKKANDKARALSQARSKLTP